VDGSLWKRRNQMSDRYGYGVPKLQEKQMPTGPKKGGNTDIKMPNPARVGPASNSASDPDIASELNAEKDFRALVAAKKTLAAITSNPARYAAAKAVGVKLQNAGGKVNERGPDGHVTAARGSPARDSNAAYDRRAAPNKPTNGVRSDGGKGRW